MLHHLGTAAWKSVPTLLPLTPAVLLCEKIKTGCRKLVKLPHLCVESLLHWGSSKYHVCCQNGQDPITDFAGRTSVKKMGITVPSQIWPFGMVQIWPWLIAVYRNPLTSICLDYFCDPSVGKLYGKVVLQTTRVPLYFMLSVLGGVVWRRDKNVFRTLPKIWIE